MPSKLESVVDLLGQLGCRKISWPREDWENPGEYEVVVSCPAAPFVPEHKHKEDKTPSMGVRIREGDTCLSHCFTCGTKGGTLPELVRALSALDDKFMRFEGIAAELDELSLVTVAEKLPAYGTWGSRVHATPPSAIEESLRPFAGKYHPYLGRRGITIEAAKSWELGYDKERVRVTIPVRDPKGELVGLQGRGIHKHIKPRYTNYWKFERGLCVLGVHRMNRTWPTVVVEGPFDLVRVWWAMRNDEFNVGCTFGAEHTPEQRELLIQHSAELVAFYDRNQAGVRGTRELIKYAHRRIRMKQVLYSDSEFDDPGAMGDEEIRGRVLSARIR